MCRASLTTIVCGIRLVDLDIPVVSLEDVYGGKLVAALDRRHPRDLFDVMQLFAHEGIAPGIRYVFVVYLVSHNRPVHEVLFPSLRDIRYDYERNVQGMTAEPVPLDALLAARECMVRELQQGLDDDERRFLQSFVAGGPEWPLLGIAHLEHLPGIRWKLHNLAQLQKTNAKKFAEQANVLAARLAVVAPPVMGDGINIDILYHFTGAGFLRPLGRAGRASGFGRHCPISDTKDSSESSQLWTQ